MSKTAELGVIDVGFSSGSSGGAVVTWRLALHGGFTAALGATGARHPPPPHPQRCRILVVDVDDHHRERWRWCGPAPSSAAAAPLQCRSDAAPQSAPARASGIVNESMPHGIVTHN